MGIYQHVDVFAGMPVVEWAPGIEIENPKQTAVRISLDYDETEDGAHWSDKLGALLSDPVASRVRGIVAGSWDSEDYVYKSSTTVVEPLAAARDRLAGLRAIFIGDITQEEHEISWIEQSDLSPLITAYPRLTHLQVRGSQGLVFGKIALPRLKSLVIQCGGLPVRVLREVLAAELPMLEHLELWLGEGHYGWDGTVDDLAPLLQGNLFPKLRYLGLRDSEIADEVAIAVAQAPILRRIKVLDLSMGTLGDEGALALLKSPAIRRLKKLDIHHHYCGEAMIAELQALGGIEIDASDPTEPQVWGDEEHRYIEVGE